ncbi:glycoside hydrolase family 2 protein [Puia sp. P3]|uniref:glycoside hydrolase family 2 protein n=1 Tax=Puia sp. P3 TaxID=3423952 RepID=UPI003D671B13
MDNFQRNTTLILLFLIFNCSGLFAQKATLPTQWTKTALAAETPFPEYPRPQLQRSAWMPLNGKWDYQGGAAIADALDPEKPIAFDKTEQILVPYCPESVLSGIRRKQEINMWYRRKLTIPDTWKNKQIIIQLEAVAHHTTLFVNGRKIGSHAGSYDAFSFDITKYLTNGDNTLIAAVKDANDGRVPSGKSGPRGDYTFCSGIWQSVWLEPVSKNYVENIRLLPDLTNSRLKVWVSTPAPAKLTATAFDGDKPVATTESTTGTYFYLPIKSPKTWSPDTPFLYDLKIRLEEGGKTIDEITSYFGMRDIRLGKLNGTIRPIINGKFTMQLGLLDQGYWPDGILTAPTEEAMKFDMQFTKNAGFNLIRKHMKTEPRRFYYWADKLGLFVWQDMPAIWYQNEDTARTRTEFRKELKALIDQHYNSPSIITWVPFNENWGAFDAKEIADWVKQYDPSRLVNGNSGFNNNPSYQKAYGDPGNGDYVDTHIYVGPYGASKPDDHRAASLGEFGGVGLFVRDHMWPVHNNAYDYEPTRSRLTDRYVFLLDEVEQLMKYKGLSVAIYTQTTDVEHEINGILTYDRAVEKMETDRVRAVNEAVIRSGYALSQQTNLTY